MTTHFLKQTSACTRRLPLSAYRRVDLKSRPWTSTSGLIRVSSRLVRFQQTSVLVTTRLVLSWYSAHDVDKTGSRKDVLTPHALPLRDDLQAGELRKTCWGAEILAEVPSRLQKG